MARQRYLTRRVTLSLGAAVAGAMVTGVGAANAEPDSPNTRYRGYSEHDRTRPYAKYMADRTAREPAPVSAAYAGPPTAAADIPDFSALRADLAATGSSPIETGYGHTASGQAWVAVRTEMPRVTAAMWDWWFGWHSSESARYKLWHPDAHLYAAIAADRTAAPLPDRERYVGNISYVDEYIGPKLQQLAIAFQDPIVHGFDVPEGQTVVFGRVGSSVAPLDVGWLAHQVRPVAGGCEMRSRFYLNMWSLRVPDLARAADAVGRGPSVDPRDIAADLDAARDLLLHCGQEMNHLAGFLPELYREFR
ncbi:DAPG hydrolase family protein [Nocardia noduli]|uniref:DAPG hydrolase family protein n=1 Tax=Nocardia noduli TaxID=2815722 RepID=UPI0027E0A132|nr:hypothetical protein [Nocardia noduli]